VNGRELKAPDVKYSLERFAAKSGFRARFDDVDRVEVMDDYTVKIITKHPFAPLLAQLASPSHNMILPKEAEDQYGDFNKAEAAIGTGPFILERYERGVKLIFKRNPDFYMKGLPYVDGIEWQMTPDASARVSLLRTGKVDFVHTTGLLAGEEAIPLQRTNADLKFFKYQSLNQGMFYMRTDQPPFNDIRVRRALSLAINRQAWMEAIEVGEGASSPGRCRVRCQTGDWIQRTSTRPRPNIWWVSTARKRSAYWLRPATPRVLIPRCFIIRVIRSPGPHASNWRWMN
jgi:peptide/nickel transport system substrate-binding protein